MRLRTARTRTRERHWKFVFSVCRLQIKCIVYSIFVCFSQADIYMSIIYQTRYTIQIGNIFQDIHQNHVVT